MGTTPAVEPYSRWEILNAWVPNSDGTSAPYPHRCIYLGLSQTKSGRLIVMGITSDMSRRIPELSVDIHGQPGGDPISGLTKPSLVQVSWVEHILPESVRGCVGIVPENLRTDIAQRFNKWVARKR